MHLLSTKTFPVVRGTRQTTDVSQPFPLLQVFTEGFGTNLYSAIVTFCTLNHRSELTNSRQHGKAGESGNPNLNPQLSNLSREMKLLDITKLERRTFQKGHSCCHHCLLKWQCFSEIQAAWAEHWSKMKSS